MSWCLRLLSALLIVGYSDAPAGRNGPLPSLWGDLKPGPHAVGFRNTWERDFSRRYNTVFDDGTSHASGKAPRPILVNIWYPAREIEGSRPMPHRDYLRTDAADLQLAKFASKLAEYERTIICKEVMGKEPKALSEPERARLETLLDTPTACHRDAPPLAGRFPLVVYHSGAQSSYEDNAVFCEFLASHGYVVVGSAFQDAAGRFFDMGSGDGSARDLEFLIAYGGRLPNVDWRHIGLVGGAIALCWVIWPGGARGIPGTLEAAT